MTMNQGGSPNAPRDFGTTPQQAEAQVNSWVADVAAKAERYQAMQERVAAITGTAVSSDGGIRITVAASGVPTDLELSDRVLEQGGQRLAAAVLDTMRRAQSTLSTQVADVMNETVGDDPQTVAAVVNTYEERFPTPTDGDGHASDGHDGVQELEFGPDDDDDWRR